MEKVKVIYQVEAESEEEASIKAKHGDARFCDAILLGEPEEKFEFEILE
jgi:hypothetical protein